MALCKRHKATLIIAKLDRLARNVRFISSLMGSGVQFQAVDMPETNWLNARSIPTLNGGSWHAATVGRRLAAG